MVLKAQFNMVGMMVAAIIIVFAIGVAPAIVEFSTGARNETDLVGGTGLNCSNADLSDYDKGACGIIDLYGFWFVGILVGLAAVYFVSKVILEAVS